MLVGSCRLVAPHQNGKTSAVRLLSSAFCLDSVLLCVFKFVCVALQGDVCKLTTPLLG